MLSLIRQFAIIFLVLFSTSAVAVDDIGAFQMDGDAMDSTYPPSPFPPVTGDDWDTLWNSGNNNGGTPLVFTGIRHDHDPDDIFSGGKKDIQDVSEWTWKHGTPLDKGNITHAYAAAYLCPDGGLGDECSDGDVVAYFGADRSSNKGDTFMGFWFFRQDVQALNDGSFSNHHENGDTLVLVNFPQATNAHPEIRVVKWDDSCTKAVNNPVVGDCAAKNLALVYEGVVCHSVASDDACAITNSAELFPNSSSSMAAGTVLSPWDYVSKNPDVNCTGPYCFPYETFFEGGINLTKLVALGGNTCFASFMAETRSSSEFTATLKDFSLDQFPLCALELSKLCGTGVYSSSSGALEIPYTITVENTGSATVQTVNATDDMCGTGTRAFTFTNVEVGSPQTAEGTCQILPGLLTPPVENGVMATASDGTAVVLADSCTTKDGLPGWCFDGCDYDMSPAIGVTKECDTRLLAEGGEVKVKVHFNGVVTNTSNVPRCEDGACLSSAEPCTSDEECEAAPAPLLDVQVVDNNGTPVDESDDVLLMLTDMGGTPLPTPVTLEPGASAYFNDEYRPSILNAECPSLAVFSDVVTATGIDAYSGDVVGPEYGPADCTLCEEGNCE